MTLSKLSLRNAKRQTGDYLVYFATIVMVAALIYAFNGLIFSQELQTLSSAMAQLPPIIVMASVGVVCIISWLVSYTTNFILSQRSREFGTYVLIGLENRQVARLFFLENLAVGGCALVLGLLLGNLLFQALRSLVFALFGTPYFFSFFFSSQAVGLTLLYFVFIYLFAQLKSRKRIHRMKIYDLIYYERQNESAVIQSGRRRHLFTASIVLGVAGTVLLIVGDVLFGVTGAGCIVAALYGFFLSFASGIPAFFGKHPAQKYRGQTLLVFRTLTAKLSTMGILMATISVLLTATMLTEGTGLVFRGIFQGRAAENACFDLYIGIDDRQQDPAVYLDFVNKNIPVEQSLTYQVYLSENDQVMDYLAACAEYDRLNYDRDPLMRYSDYAALRAIAGYPPVKLEPGTYLIHGMVYLMGPLKAYSNPITAGGITLTPGGICTERFLQSSYAVNGHGYILIVPDEAAEGLSIHHWAYAAKTTQPVSETQFAALQAINEDESRANPMAYDTIRTKAGQEAEAAAMTALTVFPLFYLALVLTMTAAAILTIQQLSETNRLRCQFELLRKLGMSRQEMTGVLRKLFVIYYSMPAVPPVLITVPFLFHMAGIVEPGTMVGTSQPAVITAAALGLFFLIYAIYILLAYTSLRRNVMPE